MELNNKGLREFGFVTGSIVAILFGLFVPWLFNKEYPLWPWYIFAILALVAVVLPAALKPVYNVWMRFGMVMGWINTRLILGVVFYIMFTPVAMILKILGKDPMHRKLDDNMQSYRIISRTATRENMEKPF
jgi:hypothetical protein